jgi:2-C-methyl-D-erythritol 4-phosphate cytidylyltransferase
MKIRIYLLYNISKINKIMQNIYAIILAGGYGKRLNSELPKQFILLNKKPVIIHTIEKFSLPRISGIIIVVPEDYISYTEKLLKQYSIKNIIKIIKGGETRQGSSYNAIKCMNFNGSDILLFHDAARPFISKKIISNCIEETESNGSAGVYVRTTDTIAEIENKFVKSIPRRDLLYNTQTPQAFKYNIIKEAHDLGLSSENIPTDDVQLVINAGYKVKICEGDYNNIKITSQSDLDFAEFLLNKTGHSGMSG